VSVLVISNAGAARARRGLPALRAALPDSDGVLHRVTEQPEELVSLVGHDRWRPDDLIVVNGGDGSVQHVLTALLSRCPSERLPRLACLPGGTTNMTAYDVNAHRRFGDCANVLRRVLAPGEQVPPAPRSVVRVRARRAGSAQLGLFFGIGTIVQGIEYFHARVRHNGGAHELGAGAALVRTLWGIARHQPPFSQPLEVRVRAPELMDGHGCEETPGKVSARLLFATTLDRLFLGIRPYWGTGAGPLKTTLVERRAPGFVSRMPRLLRGRPDRVMTAARGYHSAGLHDLTLTFDGSYTLDGELFTNPDDTLDVSASDPVKFLPL